ncbi:MAG: MFS transporter [Cyanobacteria bacterium HKST-UBA02]|nr:MFS transporter [Cyanobacteria bacterium HKST-UBA02]
MRKLTGFLSREFRQTFRSLKYRDLRIFFAGQIISLSCTWMQMVALSWLVWRMTRSPFMLGVVEGSNLLPMLLFGLAGGALADRADRRRVMITTQILAMCQATVLAVLTLTNNIQVWHCVLLALFLGTVNAFEVPSRQAFVVNLVEREDLVNTISLGSSMFNVARSLGPAAAGILVSMTSEGVCFTINAISYCAALTALLLIKGGRKTEEGSEKVEEKKLSDGVNFVTSKTSVRRIVILACIISLFGLQYSVVLPIFASEILGGGVEVLGALRACNGVGALLAALTLASRAHGGILRPGVGVAAFIYGLSLLAFSFSKTLWLSELIMLFTGFAMVTMLSGAHSLVQLAVPDNLRGRVMSIYMTVLLGLAPIGSFFIGWLASRIGAPEALHLNATIVAIAGVVYLIDWTSNRHR